MLEFDCRFRYSDGFELNACFEADSGCTVLLGQSGAGKSTILSLIAGLLRPDQGRIRVADRLLFDDAAGVDIPVHRRGVGMVSQSDSLFPHLSVRGNLEFGRRFRQPGFCDVDLDSLIDEFGLRPLLDRQPGSLSGGEAGRVALARAVASRPGLLLLDEPTGSLDPGTRQQILDYLKPVIRRWNVPVILVTHDRQEADALADHLLCVSEGRLSDPRPN